MSNVVSVFKNGIIPDGRYRRIDIKAYGIWYIYSQVFGGVPNIPAGTYLTGGTYYGGNGIVYVDPRKQLLPTVAAREAFHMTVTKDRSTNQQMGANYWYGSKKMPNFNEIVIEAITK